MITKTSARTLKKMEKILGTKLTLGNLIRSIRECDEISQATIARKLGITSQHLCDIERGRKPVSPKLAAKYAKILGYSREQFIRLALQDLVDREGLNVEVEITAKKAA